MDILHFNSFTPSQAGTLLNEKYLIDLPNHFVGVLMLELVSRWKNKTDEVTTDSLKQSSNKNQR